MYTYKEAVAILAGMSLCKEPNITCTQCPAMHLFMDCPLNGKQPDKVYQEALLRVKIQTPPYQD